MKRDYVFRVRLTQKEHRDLERAAKASGLSAADFMRDLIKREVWKGKERAQ